MTRRIIMAYIDISGVIPPMITPFDHNGDVDFDKFEDNIRNWNQTKLAGYLVLGSNGETPYITENDKLRLIERTVNTATTEKLIVVGTGLESTKGTIELTNKAAKIGADCALILTPNYYGDQMGDKAQIAFFTEVADKSTIPILIYNVAKFTNINISAKAVSVLSSHPNIVGMKDSSGNIAQLISFMTNGIDPEFNLIVGTASVWYPALSIGVKGAIMALANCCPEECVEVLSLFQDGKHQESLELYKRLFPVNACVTGKLGVPALKYACDLLGYQGGYSCTPLLPLTEQERQDVESILKRADLI